MTTLSDVKAWLLGFLAVVFFMGMLLAGGLCGGFLIGRWWGEWEVFYLMDMPQGSVVLSSRTGAYWHKMPDDTLRFVRIPDPRQARVTRMFSTPKGKEKEDEKGTDSDKPADAAGDKG